MFKALLHVLALAWLASSLQARTIELKPDGDWFSVLHGNGLKPGDQVVLRAGTYSDRRMLVLKHRGTEDNPIIIGAKGGEKVIFQRPDTKQNSFNLVGVQYLTLKGFEITGGSSGIRISADGDTQPKHVTLEELHIHHIGGPAVTCNHKGSFYERMLFRRNHIHHTGGHGEGFYLGCNNDKDGSTPGYIFNSIIEGNYIHDLNGENISQGDGIEIKDGSYRNIVRDNVIHDTNYPGIIVYGSDGKAPNLVLRNMIWNTGDHGIQAAADAAIEFNIIFDTGGDAIHIRGHQSANPSDISITHNTLIQTKIGKVGLRIQRPASGFSKEITVANNAIYAPIALRTPKDNKLKLLSNAGKGNSDDKTLDHKAWNPGGELTKDLDVNYYPTPNSFLKGKGSIKGYHSTQSPRWEGTKLPNDFTMHVYGGNFVAVDVGAYRYLDENQGWPIQKGFKDLKK